RRPGAGSARCGGARAPPVAGFMSWNCTSRRPTTCWSRRIPWPTGNAGTCGGTSSSTGCPTTRCWTRATPASAAGRARPPRHPEATSAAAAGPAETRPSAASTPSAAGSRPRTRPPTPGLDPPASSRGPTGAWGCPHRPGALSPLPLQPDGGGTGWRKAAHVAHHRPTLLFAEQVLKGGHVSAGHTLADEPVQLPVGVEGRVQGQVRRRRPHLPGQQAVAPPLRAVADGAVGLEQFLAPREGAGGGGHRVGGVGRRIALGHRGGYHLPEAHRQQRVRGRLQGRIGRPAPGDADGPDGKDDHAHVDEEPQHTCGPPQGPVPGKVPDLLGFPRAVHGPELYGNGLGTATTRRGRHVDE